MIFVTGFARGGTSWLRDCLGSHPDVTRVPGELPVFARPPFERGAVEAAIEATLREKNLEGERFVSKAPANAPHLAEAARAFPGARFVFIIRDPRDVFTSHKRGDRDWLRGSNSRVQGCMDKIRRYYDGYVHAAHRDNVYLIRYEDLHQDFEATMPRLLELLGLSSDPGIVDRIRRENDFRARTGRRHTEDRGSPRRKGVVGDWATALGRREVAWFRNDRFWSRFLEAHGYPERPLSYAAILEAMRAAGVHEVTEQELLDCAVDPDRAQVVIMHDLDVLGDRASHRSVLRSARIAADFGFGCLYNVLPLDDRRYQGASPGKIGRLLRKLRRTNPKATLGLHVNATERFFPAEAPDAGNEHPDVERAIAYLHEQVDAYLEIGVSFRIATAHGYGRGKRLPNNRDTPVFGEELLKRGIHLFDSHLRPQIRERAKVYASFTDVGKPLAVRGMPDAGPLGDPETYRRLPGGTFVRFLNHPGNYPIDRPMTLAMRARSAAATSPRAAVVESA